MALDEKIFQKAADLVNQRPIPADLVEQLDQLRETVPEADLAEFDWFYEAAMQAPGGPDVL